jgi:FMN phosphatase YigB (HAD superfamily)
MSQVKAIGFDLFNTLITVEPPTIQEAAVRLTSALVEAGLPVEAGSFQQAHRESALQFLRQSRKDGRETHNRFWISEALVSQGHRVHPDDPRIALAVDAYFSAFLEFSHPLPGTMEMLVELKGRCPLGNWATASLTQWSSSG